MPLFSLADDAFSLHTERLSLRPIALEDAKILWPYTSDAETSRYMGWHPHAALAETEYFVQDAVACMRKREALHWCIWHDDTFVGVCSIGDIKTSRHSLTLSHGEFSYWCVPAQQGKGLMTEAARGVVAFAFDMAGFHKLHIAHRVDNVASARLIGRLNFRLVGTQREHYCKDGIWHDQLAYEMLASD